MQVEFESDLKDSGGSRRSGINRQGGGTNLVFGYYFPEKLHEN